MRYIGILIALLAVGWLVMTQLQSSPTGLSTDTAEAVESVDAPANVPTQVPRNAEEMNEFEAQINSLNQGHNARTQEALEQTQ